MLKDKVIIIPYNLPQTWVCDYLEQTRHVLEKNNKIIAYLVEEAKSFREIMLSTFHFIKNKGNTIYITPIHFLPFRRFEKIAQINLILNTLLIRIFILFSPQFWGKKKILWLFGPEHHHLIGKFGETISLYDCVDYHSSISSGQDKFKKNEEKKLMQKVDLVFTNSPVLYRLKKDFHAKVFQVPQGCNTDIFLRTPKIFLPGDLANIHPPRIGYLGNIDYRLDYRLIKNLALNNPQWSFIFIGPRAGDPVQDKIKDIEKNIRMLAKIKNIFFLGNKSKLKLLGYIDHLEITIIPHHVKLDFVRYSYPMKVFEYFCRGKPVVSTYIESLIPLKPYVKMAKNAKEFEKEIKNILNSHWPWHYKLAQKKLALANSWEKKIERISEIIAN